jgi:hypothetical protein
VFLARFACCSQLQCSVAPTLLHRQLILSEQFVLHTQQEALGRHDSEDIQVLLSEPTDAVAYIIAAKCAIKRLLLSPHMRQLAPLRRGSSSIMLSVPQLHALVKDKYCSAGDTLRDVKTWNRWINEGSELEKLPECARGRTRAQVIKGFSAENGAYYKLQLAPISLEESRAGITDQLLSAGSCEGSTLGAAAVAMAAVAAAAADVSTANDTSTNNEENNTMTDCIRKFYTLIIFSILILLDRFVTSFCHQQQRSD